MSEPWKIIASFQQRKVIGCFRIILNRNQAELKPNVEAKATERYLIWVCLLFSSPSNSKSGSVLWRKTTISSTCTLMSMLYLLQTILKGRTISKTEPFPRHNQVNIGQKLLVLGRSDQTHALWFGFFSNFDFRNSSILLGRSGQTHAQWFGKFKSKQMCLLCICMFCLQQSQNTRV